MTQEPMISIRDYLPCCDVPFYAVTRHGTRQVLALPYIGYMYLDCTHPMQNNRCDIFDIIEWRYCDERFAEHLPLVKNTWMKQAEADHILSNITKPNIYDRLMFLIKSLRKRKKS